MTIKQEQNGSESVLEVMGFSLFKEVEDRDLRCHNQGVIMANIIEDNLFDGDKLSGSATILLLKYFQAIPLEDKPIALMNSQSILTERGIVAHELFNGSQHQQLH